MYGQKVLLVAHSWGDNVARNFLYWMEETSPGWVEEHVAVHFNVGGPVLGVPKALTSLLSGPSPPPPLTAVTASAAAAGHVLVAGHRGACRGPG